MFNSNYQKWKNDLKEAITFLDTKIKQLVKYQEDADESRKDLNTAIIVIISVTLALLLGLLFW